MLAVLWGLFLAAQTVTALLFPKQQQLVNYRRKDDFSPTSYQFQAWKPVLPKKQEWTPLLPKQQVIYEEDSRSENQHQRMFHLPRKAVAFHHQSHGLSPKVQQDEHRRSMALPESLVAQQNVSFAKENIQAAMVQKVLKRIIIATCCLATRFRLFQSCHIIFKSPFLQVRDLLSAAGAVDRTRSSTAVVDEKKSNKISEEAKEENSDLTLGNTTDEIEGETNIKAENGTDISTEKTKTPQVLYIDQC